MPPRIKDQKVTVTPQQQAHVQKDAPIGGVSWNAIARFATVAALIPVVWLILGPIWNHSLEFRQMDDRLDGVVSSSIPELRDSVRNITSELHELQRQVSVLLALQGRTSGVNYNEILSIDSLNQVPPETLLKALDSYMVLRKQSEFRAMQEIMSRLGLAAEEAQRIANAINAGVQDEGVEPAQDDLDDGTQERMPMAPESTSPIGD